MYEHKKVVQSRRLRPYVNLALVGRAGFSCGQERAGTARAALMPSGWKVRPAAPMCAFVSHLPLLYSFREHFCSPKVPFHGVAAGHPVGCGVVLRPRTALTVPTWPRRTGAARGRAGAALSRLWGCDGAVTHCGLRGENSRCSCCRGRHKGPLCGKTKSLCVTAADTLEPRSARQHKSRLASYCLFM